MPVTISEDTFGQAKNPYVDRIDDIKRFTFKNDKNVTIQVISYGATITTVKLPDGQGVVEDVVLGFDDIAGYHLANNPYFGATVGRVCNRIGGGSFVLNGQKYNLNKNRGEFQLHGGFIGFDKVHWLASREGDTVVMTHHSADGDEGFPGEVNAKVVFRLGNDNDFHCDFYATSTKPTPVNLTNHSYFNLAGHSAGSNAVYDHFVKIKADKITETDADSIPTGQLLNVAGTAYDLQTLGKLGPQIQKSPLKGYDNNFCVNLDKNGQTTVIAKAWHPESGRFLEVATNQPGVQFYTGNNLPNPATGAQPIPGKGGAQYVKHGAFCLETQKYPDSVNHPEFPSTIINPGQTYHHEVIYKFGTCNDDVSKVQV